MGTTAGAAAAQQQADANVFNAKMAEQQSQMDALQVAGQVGNAGISAAKK